MDRLKVSRSFSRLGSEHGTKFVGKGGFKCHMIHWTRWPLKMLQASNLIIGWFLNCPQLPSGWLLQTSKTTSTCLNSLPGSWSNTLLASGYTNKKRMTYPKGEEDGVWFWTLGCCTSPTIVFTRQLQVIPELVVETYEKPHTLLSSCSKVGLN